MGRVVEGGVGRGSLEVGLAIVNLLHKGQEY